MSLLSEDIERDTYLCSDYITYLCFKRICFENDNFYISGSGQTLLDLSSLSSWTYSRCDQVLEWRTCTGRRSAERGEFSSKVPRNIVTIRSLEFCNMMPCTSKSTLNRLSFAWSLSGRIGLPFHRSMRVRNAPSIVDVYYQLRLVVALAWVSMP